MNNFGAQSADYSSFQFSVFSFQNAEFGGMSFGFEYGKLEEFCTGGTPAPPGSIAQRLTVENNI